MTYFPDVNVWIALAAERHMHHRAARYWFGNLRDEKLAFCRLTQLGFLRPLTNKHVMQEEVMRPDGAWQAYRVLRLDRRIGYLIQPDGLPETWQQFTDGLLTSPNLWTRCVPLRIRPCRPIDLGNVRCENPNKGRCELSSTRGTS